MRTAKDKIYLDKQTIRDAISSVINHGSERECLIEKYLFEVLEL